MNIEEDKKRFGAGSQSESKVEAFERFRFERGFQRIELPCRAGQRERRGRKGSTKPPSSFDWLPSFWDRIVPMFSLRRNKLLIRWRLPLRRIFRD